MKARKKEDKWVDVLIKKVKVDEEQFKMSEWEGAARAQGSKNVQLMRKTQLFIVVKK